jgi:hypothetical protein
MPKVAPAEVDDRTTGREISDPSNPEYATKSGTTSTVGPIYDEMILESELTESKQPPHGGVREHGLSLV